MKEVPMREDNNKKATLSDEEIIELYWNRDEKAIDQTDKKYGRYLYTIAHNIVHDDLDSEECLNDTYIGTWNQIPPTRPNIFQVFLAKITRNIATNKFKKNRASKRIPSELIVSLDELDDCIPSTPTAEEEFETQEIARLLNSYLDGLSRQDQLLFICRYYYADRITEIAQITGINERNVYRILETIRDGLKKELEKEGYTV